ncbi:MAG: sensor histidine kinase [Rectinemataceae bacterium]
MGATALRAISLFSLFLFLSAAVLGCTSPRGPAPVAKGGVLDLRSWDFGRDGDVRLAGDWDFFPGVLLGGSGAIEAPRSMERRVPDRWPGFGACTYRLQVLLPASFPPLALSYTTVSTAFELEAGGRLVASAGKPALAPAQAEAAYRPGVALVPKTDGPLELVARVSNYEYRVGGMWRVFYLGPAAALERTRWARESISFALASSIAMVALLAAIFALFTRGSEHAWSFLTFSLFAVMAALRSLVTGEYSIVDLFPSMGFGTIIRLEYLSSYSLFPLGLLFFSFLFRKDFGMKSGKVLLAACAVFLLLVPVAPLRLLTWSLIPYYALSGLVIAAVAATEVRALAHRRPGGVPILIGSVALLAAGVNDPLYSSFIVHTGNYFPFGVLFYVGMQAYALTSRYHATQRMLRETLAEKEMLFKEIHHRVKNSLQIISSIASLQSHREKDPAVLSALASMQGRIRAISMVHEKLYAVESTEVIDLGEYVRDLAAQLSKSYGEGSESSVLVDAQSLFLPADLCIDLGLLMTELVSNSYKHALIPGRDGKIRVRLHGEAGELVLAVEDDGPGFPSGISIEGTSSLGFRIIGSLAKKRGAEVRLRRGPGAVVEIRVPLGSSGTSPRDREEIHRDDSRVRSKKCPGKRF